MGNWRLEKLWNIRRCYFIIYVARLHDVFSKMKNFLLFTIQFYVVIHTYMFWQQVKMNHTQIIKWNGVREQNKWRKSFANFHEQLLTGWDFIFFFTFSSFECVQHIILQAHGPYVIWLRFCCFCFYFYLCLPSNEFGWTSHY